MYQSVYYDDRKYQIHIFDDNKGHTTHKYVKYCYVKDPKGMYRTLDGTKVKKVIMRNVNNISKEDIYESDVRPDMRFLIDNYYNSDEISKNHVTLNFDIEVDSTEGFPLASISENKITSIAAHVKEIDSFFVLILDEKKSIKNKKNDNVHIMSFSTERDLLMQFLKIYSNLKPTILTGWNIEMFDIPYLYNRLLKIVGSDYANTLSPIGVIEDKPMIEGAYRIAGVNILDYMELYKYFTQNESQRYTLDFIGKKEVNLGKIEYEGSLDVLYKENIHKFIKYNLRDVSIVKKLDEKLNLIELTKGICHKGHVKYEDIFYSSRYLEGAILTYTKKKGIVVPNKVDFKIKLKRNHNPEEKLLQINKKINDHFPRKGKISIAKSKSVKKFIEYVNIKNDCFILSEELGEYIKKEYPLAIEFSGAYVKKPMIGKHAWLFDLDLKSMYPFTIISLNISPETKVGNLEEFNPYDFIKETKDESIYNVNYINKKSKMNNKELRSFLKVNNLSISSNGILYDMNRKGLVPIILENWSAERDEYNKLYKKYGDENNKDKRDFYFERQRIQKVLLNSLYGTLGLSVFRFYDVENAEAVTISGQTLIKFSEKSANYFYNRELNEGIYEIELEDGTVLELKENDKVKVKRNNVELEVEAKNLKETDEII